MLSRYLGPALILWMCTQAAPLAAQPDADDADAANGAASVLHPGKIVRPLFPPNPLERLGTDAGLPQAFVKAIAQSPSGFMWFGTQSGGVARYDGYEMRTITKDPKAKLSLSSGFITSLAFDVAGHLWIGTGEAGVNVYDPERDSLTHYAHKDGVDGTLSASGVTALYRDRMDRMWVATGDGSLNRFDPETQTFSVVHVSEDPEVEIYTVRQSSGETLWVGTSVGLLRVDADNGSVVQTIVGGDGPGDMSGDEAHAVLEDRDGTLWIGTDAGLNRLDRGSSEFVRYHPQSGRRDTISGDFINALFEDDEGVLWIGTENGLNELSADRKTLTRYARDDSDPVATQGYPAYVSTIFQDQGGVLWFGERSGARMIDPLRKKFHMYQFASVGGEPMTYAEGEGGVIWAGTYDTGLQKIDRAAGEVTIYPYLGDPRRRDAVRLDAWLTGMCYAKGTLWFSGGDLGLVSFDTRTERYRRYPPDPDGLSGPAVGRVEHIITDRQGRLWMATWGGGLSSLDPRTGSFIRFAHESDDDETISGDFLYTVRFDVKDSKTLWIGTARAGLNRFNIETGVSERIDIAPKGGDPLRYDSVQTIYQEPSGLLWLGTSGGGLVSLDPNTDKREYFGEEDGLPNPTIYGILADKDGELWMSTNGGGIASFDPKERAFVNYTTADGLISNEFVQGAYYQSSTGEMFFSGGGGAAGTGFNAFFPSEIAPDDYAPPIAITRLQIFDKDADLDAPIWTAPDISLGYSQSVFSFEFAALSYADVEGVRYAYKMDGVHDWVETSRRFVTYTNLDGGDYVFRVKAANRHGVWSKGEVAVSVAVAPPPWRTWWAYTLYILVIMGIIFAYVRYQSRKVEQLRQQHRLESVERELELTGAVQTGFLPSKAFMDNGQFRVQGFYRPADRASGDWWWYEESGSTLTVLIGDVTGHGPGPAMVTAAAATAFRISGKAAGSTMRDRLQSLNEEVLRVGAGEYHMSLSAVEIDGQTGRFTIYSAGGLPIMRLRQGDRPRLVPCAGSLLGSDGFQLGLVDGKLSPGDRILIYTDGIPELMLATGRMLGMRRFSMICENTVGLDLAAATQHLVTTADSLRGGSEQDDDWTLAFVEWTLPRSALTPRSDV